MTCRKIPYQTKRDALTDAALIKNQAKHFTKSRRAHVKKSGGKQYPYQCNRCGLWHLTSEHPKHRR